ncbi:MAG: DUF5350 family protein [Methanospirillum sp.]|nr:DUF5350 family protein [Methanospirillum sp.]
MGKTGTTQWVQIKGAKGQLRLVPAKEGGLKKPGPNQRYKAGITVKKLDAISEANSRNPRRRGGRGGRGGRGRPGESEEKLIRSRVQRAKVSIVGPKQRSGR